MRPGSLTVSTQREVPVGAAEHAGDDVGDVEDAGDEEDLFDALVVALDDESPDEEGADGDADVLADVEELHAAGDAGELGDDVAVVDDDEQDHHHEGDAQAELFADEVAEAFAGDDAHARAHLLHDDEREGDGDHRPEQGVAELRAGLGVGEDAAGVVVDVGGDEARPEDGEEEKDSGSPAAPEAHPADRRSDACGRLDLGEQVLHALEDELDLAVVVVSVAQGSGASGGGDAGAGGLVGEIAADLGGALVEGGEEDGLLVLAEALEVAFGALGEEEALAAGDLEALVDELVLVGVGEEAEVDFGAPDGFAVLLLVDLALAVEQGVVDSGRGRASSGGALPEMTTWNCFRSESFMRVSARSS